MIKRFLILAALSAVSVPASAVQKPAGSADSAASFGARENVLDINLSPDGKTVAYIAPRSGQGNALYTVDLATGEPKVATAADGKPLRLSSCNWISNDRLLCRIFAYHKGAGEIVVSSRLIAVNADGTGLKLVSQLPGANALGSTQYGGGVIDYLPAEDGAVLMTRVFIPEAKIGSIIEKRDEGFGVERIDTRTGKTKLVEPAKLEAAEYITDGRGNVRIMGMMPRKGDGYAGRVINYFYRSAGSRAWKPLGSYDVLTGAGFNPYAVDPDKNVVYGFKKKDGRLALYSVLLDDSLRGELVYAHPSVDVTGLLQIGRQRRVVGATFATEKREAVYFDKDVEAMDKALGKALPGLPQTQVLDASLDGSKMLVWAGSDVDPGHYYVFDRTAKRLNKILLARPQLDGVALAPVKPVSFRASDGVSVPGYLTLPPGSAGKKLPAIVLPHGGPEARDEWGFDWLAQYFANRGYAVLQPNFRGSTGYGDAWFKDNGFKSWRAAVGDVVDAGRWLVSEGIADPAKLGIFGWSYGGYAALQSNVIAPDLFKAVVAVAPVTDFKATIDSARGYTNFLIEKERVGSGPHLREGSPAQNVAMFKAPVLMFHGDYDFNVEVSQSRLMAGRLRDAGKKAELIVYPGLDHQLDDSTVRADMLRRSDAFLRASMGM